MTQALTETQYDYVRGEIGDTSSNQEISDAALQLIFNDPAQGNLNADYTIYFALRRLRAKYRNEIAQTTPNTGFTIQAQQKFDHVNLMLQEWGGRTGLGGQGLSAGVIGLDLDAHWCDEQGW